MPNENPSEIVAVVDFAITGGSHRTTFSFKTPHENEIDFSAQISA
jgi:hypothetical protein